MSRLDDWTGAACAELGLDPAALDVPLVLDLARDVAHGVARPAAPLTAYLLGVAVGQGPAGGGVGRADQRAGGSVASGRRRSGGGRPPANNPLMRSMDGPGHWHWR